MLNHNILNKISEQYIEERVDDSKKKIYFYLYTTDSEISYYNMKHTFIEADNDKDCYIKVFNELEIFYGPFIREYQDDEIIKKYIEKWGFKDINENYEFIFKDINEDYEFIEDFTCVPQTLIFEEEDTKYINELKYNFVNKLLWNAEFKILTNKYDARLSILISRYPGKPLGNR